MNEQKKITSLAEYENFDFQAGQEFKVLNSHYTVKKINGCLFILDKDNYGSELKLKNQTDHLKFALECNQEIILMTPID